MSGLSGIAAVLAAVGLSSESRDSVPRDALNSAITAALAEGEKAGVIKAGQDATAVAAAAVKTERGRAKSILEHEAAKGREDLAAHLAFDTDMSAEAAIAMLGKAPKAEPAKASRMGVVPNPKVETAVDDVQPGDGLLAAVDQMVAVNAKRIV